MVHANDDRLGYGRMGQQIEKCFNSRGIETVRDVDKLERVPRVVLHNRLPMHAQSKYEGQDLTLFTMFETDMVPADYVENLHNFDRLIVPSKQNLEMFKEVHPCVHYIPLGVDPNWWTPTQRKEVTAQTPFTFLTAGNGMHRKGFDIVCKAFAAASIPGAQLIVKCNPADEIWELKAKYPDVIFLQERLKAADEKALYEMAHVYVGLSRGEGFGLQPLQAIHQGLPTIASLSSGHLEYKELFYQVPTTVEDANYGIWGYCGRWWEPDLEAATDAMREMWTNYVSVQYEAYHQACRLHDVAYWTWERVANDILRILPTPMDTVEKWQLVNFHHRLFKVIPTRDVLFSINDEYAGMQSGKEYWVPPDQKRMLYDQHALDPSCLRENMGLDPQYVQEYRPYYDRCPTCQRMLDPIE
jgi:hypothetical protein